METTQITPEVSTPALRMRKELDVLGTSAKVTIYGAPDSTGFYLLLESHYEGEKILSRKVGMLDSDEVDQFEKNSQGFAAFKRVEDSPEAFAFVVSDFFEQKGYSKA